MAAAAPAAPLRRAPKLSGKADVMLWHKALHHAGGPARTPVFVRADDGAAQATLAGLGVAATRGRWALTQLDAAALQTALGAGAGLLLRSATVHRPLSVQSLKDINAAQVQA